MQMFFQKMSLSMFLKMSLFCIAVYVTRKDDDKSEKMLLSDTDLYYQSMRTSSKT